MPKRPNIDAMKERINQEPEVQEEEAPTQADLINRARPETMQQVAAFAKEVQSQREEDEAEKAALEASKVVIEEYDDDDGPSVSEDTTYYRNTNADNRKVRLAIEERCEEMDFADLVLTGRVNVGVWLNGKS